MQSRLTVPARADLSLLIFQKLMIDSWIRIGLRERVLLSFLVVQKILWIFWTDLKKKITMISFTLLRFYAFKLVFLVTLTSHVFFTRYMKIVRFIVEEYFQTWDKILTGLPNWVLSHNCQTAWNSRLKGKKSSHFFRNLWRGTFNPISLVPMLLKMWLFRLILYPFDNLQFTSQ